MKVKSQTSVNISNSWMYKIYQDFCSHVPLMELEYVRKLLDRSCHGTTSFLNDVDKGLAFTLKKKKLIPL